MGVGFEEIAKGSFIRRERDFQVFTSEESFASIHSELIETLEILWSKEILIGLFAGNKTTGGHTIAVSRIEDVPPLLKIFFEETPPRPGVITSQVVTFPGQLVSLKRTDLSSGSLTAEFITAGKVVKRQNFIN